MSHEVDVSGALPVDGSACAALRHLTATLAYRAAKVLRDVPADFGARSFGRK